MTACRRTCRRRAQLGRLPPSPHGNASYLASRERFFAFPVGPSSTLPLSVKTAKRRAAGFRLLWLAQRVQAKQMDSRQCERVKRQPSSCSLVGLVSRGGVPCTAGQSGAQRSKKVDTPFVSSARAGGTGASNSAQSPPPAQRPVFGVADKIGSLMQQWH
jgi:hypothetical protein